jgi:rubrerythrin
MFGISLKKNTEKFVKHQKYFKCERCGYITIVRDSICPICAKDGFKIKMK